LHELLERLVDQFARQIAPDNGLALDDALHLLITQVEGLRFTAVLLSVFLALSLLLLFLLVEQVESSNLRLEGVFVAFSEF